MVAYLAWLRQDDRASKQAPDTRSGDKAAMAQPKPGTAGDDEPAAATRVHGNFRLWITCEPGSYVPASLAAKCLIVAVA